MKQIFLFKISNCHCPRSVCVMKSLKVTSHYKYSKSVGAFFDKWTDREMENGFEEERLEGDSWRKPIRTNKQALPVLIRVFPCGRIVIWHEGAILYRPGPEGYFPELRGRNTETPLGFVSVGRRSPVCQHLSFHRKKTFVALVTYFV